MEQDNKIEYILEYFENMNIEGIRHYLSDQYTYSELPKEVFLVRLEQAFNDFKKEGDTALNIEKTICKKSFCNKGNQVYSFYGNVAETYLHLVFEQENNEIIDIYSCGNFY